MLSINVKIALLVVLLTPVSLFVASFIASRTYQMFRLQSEKRAEMTSLVEELVGNQKVVQAFSYERTAMERFDSINGQLQICGVRALFFSSITNSLYALCKWSGVRGCRYLWSVYSDSTGDDGRTAYQFLNYANQYTNHLTRFPVW